MSDEPTSAPALLQRPLNDGWLGTRDLPAYRAGPVVARLLGPSASSVAPWRVDLLLLAPGGQSQGIQSLPCRALPRHPSHDERSRFVRMVAELARHAAGHDHSLLAVGPALSVLCEHGVDSDSLVRAAQLLDEVSSESAVVASLCTVLDRLLGDEEARRVAAELLGALPGTPGASKPAEDLSALVTQVVRRVGKAHARRRLGEAAFVELVPQPELFDV